MWGFLQHKTAHSFLLLNNYFLMEKAKINKLLPTPKTQQKDVHSNRHHRSLMPVKNEQTLFNIMLHYNFLSLSPMQAS